MSRNKISILGLRSLRRDPVKEPQLQVLEDTLAALISFTDSPLVFNLDFWVILDLPVDLFEQPLYHASDAPYVGFSELHCVLHLHHTHQHIQPNRHQQETHPCNGDREDGPHPHQPQHHRHHGKPQQSLVDILPEAPCAGVVPREDQLVDLVHHFCVVGVLVDVPILPQLLGEIPQLPPGLGVETQPLLELVPVHQERAVLQLQRGDVLHQYTLLIIVLGPQYLLRLLFGVFQEVLELAELVEIIDFHTPLVLSLNGDPVESSKYPCVIVDEIPIKVVGDTLQHLDQPLLDLFPRTKKVDGLQTGDVTVGIVWGVQMVNHPAPKWNITLYCSNSKLQLHSTITPWNCYPLAIQLYHPIQSIYPVMNKPYIIRPGKLTQPLISPESEVYNEAQESRIQILQAANGYLTINMIYESIKLLWSFFHYRTQCADFAYLSLGFMVLDILWAVTSIYGFRSINSKNSRNITIFLYTVVGNLILRIAMYTVCGVIMKGYARDYYIIDETQKKDALCNAIYPSSLYIMQGCLEGLVCVIILVMSKSVAAYIAKWERSETNKYLSKTFNEVGEY